MVTCPECETPLAVEGVAQGEQAICVKCRSLFRVGEQVRTSVDRLAWRSLWLGLSSILLLFLTGIPAIYYGIRSLLRMRYVKSRAGDRVAAISGTALGGCFGLFGSVFAISIGGVVGFMMLTAVRVDKAPEVMALFDQVFEVDLPDQLIPSRGIEVLNAMYFFDFYDAKDTVDRSARLHLIRQKSMLRTNPSQTINQLRDRTLNDEYKLKEIQSEILKWDLAGEPVDVKKIEFEIVEDRFAESGDPNITSSVGQTISQYYGFLSNEGGITGFSLIIKEPPSTKTPTTVSTAQIRELLAELKPKF